MTAAPLLGPADEPLEVRRYRRMQVIRRFEETLLDLFAEGVLNGTTHCCIGQEANAVGVCEALAPEDHVFSHHRGHGHFLARTGDAFGLLCEIMGKRAGLCRGLGGSQHVAVPGFKTNGVQGGIVPAAAGIAWARQLRGAPGASVVWIGDGTLGEGVVYETLNMAALRKLPLLVVLEDNAWAQSTPVHANLAGSMAARFEAFGIPVTERDTTDVAAIAEAAHAARAAVADGPQALLLHTYRLCHHSKNDDHRPEAEVTARWATEPLRIHAPRVPAEVRARVDAEVEAGLAEVVAAARAAS